MKHLQSNFPDLDYLSRIAHGLLECHPEVPISVILTYINSWPGVAGKLSPCHIISVKQTAQSSFIKSAQSRVSTKFNVSMVDLQHSFLKKPLVQTSSKSSPFLKSSSESTTMKPQQSRAIQDDKESASSYQGHCVAVHRQPPIIVRPLNFDDDSSTKLRIFGSSSLPKLDILNSELKQSINSLQLITRNKQTRTMAVTSPNSYEIQI